MVSYDYIIQDFERFTNDQQFVNVVEALTKIETQQGGLTPEEIWNHAINLLDSLKKVSRPEITVKRMFSYLVDLLKEQGQGREQYQIEHSAYCILFCVVYILCAHDEAPDPNQDIIDSICEVLSGMPDIVPLFEAVEKEEDMQEAKGFIVNSRNVLAKQKTETQEEARARINMTIIKDIITPIVQSDFVQLAYKAEFDKIWNDILADEVLFEIMRQHEFNKPYNLKMVVNILALMTCNQKVIKESNHKLAKLLFPDGPNHYKYFTTEIGNTFSAFKIESEMTKVISIIEKHKK